MRALLVHTSYPYREQMVTPPLGLLYLASRLRDQGSEVAVLDRRLTGVTVATVTAAAASWKPQLIGFSSLTCEAADLITLCAAVRTAAPDALLVIGGPHPTSFPEASLETSQADAAVIGEGEDTLVELLSGKPLDRIAGIAFPANGAIAVTAPRPFIGDLDRLRHPAWDLIDLEAYARHVPYGIIKGELPYGVIMSTRGCPYRCGYCHNIFGKGYRTHSPDWVLDEMAVLVHKHGVKEIQFLDDSFNLKRQRLLDLCKRIADRFPGLKLSFPNGLRADRMDEEMIRALKNAGTYRINYAIETASPRLQKLVQKHLDLRYSRQIITLTSNCGILVHGYFILGFPTETRRDMLATIAYAYRSDIHAGVFMLFNPYPHTELFKLIPNHESLARSYRTQQYEYIRTSINTSAAPAWQLMILQRFANFILFCSVRRLFRLWQVFPRRQDIPRHIINSISRILGPRTSRRNEH